MEQKKQARKPMTLEEQRQAYLQGKAKHEQKLATDPEYRAKWEKREADFRKIALLNDSIESEEEYREKVEQLTLFPLPKSKEEQIKELRESMLEHRRKLETDEEYRKQSEEIGQVFDKLRHFGNDVED